MSGDQFGHLGGRLCGHRRGNSRLQQRIIAADITVVALVLAVVAVILDLPPPRMSSVESEVMRIRSQLEKIVHPDDPDAVNPGQSLDLLRELSRLNINLNVLTVTRIGMTVNSLRKSSTDEEVVTLAKTLIKTWKKFVPDNQDKKDRKGKDEKSRKEDEDGKKSALDTDFKAAKEIGAKSFPSRPQPTTDEVRLRCRGMLSSSLAGDGNLPDGIVKTPEELAELIEDNIFKKFRNTDVKYKNHIRSRVFNLKDKKNPSLRENVLCGVISPEKFAVMTAEEMASDEVKRQRQAFIKEGIDAAQLAQAQGTKTDLLKCGKCGKSNCTYNQIQTRSADEPMTTFVLCNECGNRWKFC